MTNFARYLNIRSATSPVLSFDGQHVAFLSDISGNFQVWSTKMDGSEWPRQLTFFEDKVWEIHGNGSNAQLIAVSDFGGNERQQLYLISNYGVDEHGHRAHDVRKLTTDTDAIHRFGAWSKDGRRIVYTSNARNHVDFDPYVMDISSGKSHPIAEASGNRAIVAWSPDTKFLLVADVQSADQTELYLMDTESGDERHVTVDQPHARYESIKWVESGVYCISDRNDDCFALCRLDLETGELHEIVCAEPLLHEFESERGELESFSVAPNGQDAALILNAEGYSILYLLDLVSGKTRLVSSIPSGILSGGKFSADESLLVYGLQSPSQNPDIWALDLTDYRCRQLTFSDRAGIARESFVKPQLVHYSTFDHMQIPAFLYLPQTPPDASGYPCILYVHGGPSSQQRPDFDVRFQYFLSQGYALFVPNVRGSTGYGRRYLTADDLELRPESVTDLKHAVEWLRDHGQINGDALAIYGRSYGGYMVLAALTEYPELFAAGIDVVGIADWVTFMERTSPWRRSHREREYGSLEHHRELLEKISPIHKAERIACPLMVLAGDNDPRVPLYESEQIVERVRNSGGTVEFIHYADEGHRFSKLSNRVDSFTKMAAFLDKYIKSV